MGWVKKITNRRGSHRYYAVYVDLQGRERSAGSFPTEDAALKASLRAEAALQQGRTADPKRGKQTFRAYVEEEWLPHHVIERTTREGYTYLLNRHILPEFGGRKMREILPVDVRAWVLDLQRRGVGVQSIRSCKVVLDAILTTALNDQVVYLHAGKGVKTPPIAKKPKRIVTTEQYERIHAALPEGVMRLLVEVDIESGLRWGELTELRPQDLDVATGVLTVSRAVVQLKARGTDDADQFLVKPYPKDKEWRQVGLAPHIVDQLVAYIESERIRAGDLLFAMPRHEGTSRRRRPDVLPDPATLGLTEPNGKGRRYAHGTLTAYQAAKCRCRYCRDAVAVYRAERRASGKDDPRPPRSTKTDGHIPNDWFRRNIWGPALKQADLGFHVTPHGLRHAHASWLLAGGANIQVVKERLGHASITTTEGYLHTLPGAHDCAIDALNAIRGRGDRHAPKAGLPSKPAQGAADSADMEELERLRKTVAQMGTLLGGLGQAG